MNNEPQSSTMSDPGLSNTYHHLPPHFAIADEFKNIHLLSLLAGSLMSKAHLANQLIAQRRVARLP